MPPAVPTSRRTVAAGVALVLVVAVAAVVWFQRDDRPRVAAGDQVAATDGQAVPGWTVDLRVPTGSYRLTVGEPTEEMPASCCTDEPADRRPPEDGSFVGVELAQVQVGPAPALEPGSEPVSPTFTLVVGSSSPADETAREYPLRLLDEAFDGGTMTTSRVRGYVAVDEVPDADEVTVAVDYDGVTQVVDPTGLRVDRAGADQLYLDAHDEEGAVRCGPRARAAGGLTFVREGEPGCTVTVQRRPWVGGLGWAGEGREWLVLSVGVDAYFSAERRVGARSYRYYTSAAGPAASLGVTVDGEAPRTTWADGDGLLVAVTPVAANTVDQHRVDTTASYSSVIAEDPDPVRVVVASWRRDI
ncbi:hypothetical protein [Nocardioides sp. 1609]|uniref:hypothetical protein n=1 Tax=Nocardioides sp. 1609 TaxID=2508327 RepID=UPI0010703BCB|nr:hypothetical protein [Nocardioides sp. 1609]